MLIQEVDSNIRTPCHVTRVVRQPPLAFLCYELSLNEFHEQKTSLQLPRSSAKSAPRVAMEQSVQPVQEDSSCPTQS